MRKSHRPRVSGNQRASRPKSGCIPFESLETRTLLSAAVSNVFITSPFSFNPPLSATSLTKTAATSTDIHDIKNGPMANAPDLVPLYIEFKHYVANGGDPTKFTSKLQGSFSIKDGAVLVTVRGTRGAVSLANMLKGLGSTISAMNGQYGTVDAYVPIIELKKVARSIQVASLSPVSNGIFHTAGSANNQADETEMADLVRSTYGVDGTGIKIGVLSNSVNQVSPGIGGSVATGDLPPDVQVIEDGPTIFQDGLIAETTDDEGRAMLELIHDLAPGAKLAFATANGGQQHFADNITALANAGCKVIVDDVGYFDEPFFQPGVIDQAITQFVQGGGVYLSAAGNDGTAAIQQSINFVTTSGKTFVDFDPGPGVATRMTINVTPGLVGATAGDAVLQWDNPYNGVTGNATADMDIYFFDARHPTKLIASATTNNLQTHLPVEEVLLPVGTYQMQIRLVSSTPNQPLPTLYRMAVLGGADLATEFAGTTATIFGHSGGPDTISVGAVPFNVVPPYGNSLGSETFSSLGPVTQVFDAEGNRLPSVTTVNKPDVSGVDGTNTSFFLGNTAVPPTPRNPLDGDTVNFVDVDPDPFPNFQGTSAAAPNVAAVVALILQEDPNATQGQIVSALKATALPLNGTSAGEFDAQGGFGLVNAFAAIQQFIQPPTAHFIPVSPNPSATAISKIKLVFSQQVSGFDVSTLNLHQPGGPNLLSGANSPTTTDGGKTWVIPSLADLTSSPGTYELDLEDDLHQIVNAAGLPLKGGATTSFTVLGSNGIPDPPTNLRAQAVTSTSIQLSWTDNSFGESGFTLQRAENPDFKGSTLKSITIAANKTSFTDTLPVAAGKIYYYRIRAFGGNDVSTFSNVARVVSLAKGEIVLDNSTGKGVAVSGPWVLNTTGSGFLGNNYLDDLNTNKGKTKVTYTPNIQSTGDYYVYARWTRAKDHATNVPITVSANGKARTITADERNTGGAGWILLGRFHLLKGTGSFVMITNKGTNGRVVADAVRFQPVSA